MCRALSQRQSFQLPHPSNQNQAHLLHQQIREQQLQQLQILKLHPGYRWLQLNYRSLLPCLNALAGGPHLEMVQFPH